MELQLHQKILSKGKHTNAMKAAILHHSKKHEGNKKEKVDLLPAHKRHS